MGRVQPASTTYKDWVGTAAAEDSIITGSGDLYELAGLNRDQWSILSIDAFAHSHGQEPSWHVHVYAFDRAAAEVTSHADLKRLAAERGSLPVTDILLHDVDLDAVIRCTKVIHVQLSSPHFSDLDIVETRDHPIQR